MILKDISLDSPEGNVLLDEVFLLQAEKFSGGEVLRFWESKKPFIVLGRIGREYEDIQIEPVKRENIPVLRRSSGGGTVVQGAGCLNYALILDKDRDRDLRDLRKSYQWISEKVIEALERQGQKPVFRPISDMALASSEKKFSGNAQRRGKNFILHHGTILYNFDLRLIARYLQMPKDIPDYRRNRPHDDFVANIPMEPQKFKQDLAQIFAVDSADNSVTIQQLALLQSLKEKSSVFVDLKPI
jgi:lipoate-protein ligase A